ncbi:MAG: protein phosphatase 2C domain-containing protein [Gemmatimonadetes bacterium]|nr:protein phosphatase 2C domain-containing protein [Gemmatimonadota bacterium]
MSLPPATPWCPEEWRAALVAVLPPACPVEEAAGDERSADIRLPDGWQLLLASRRGRLHAHRGAHREDAAAWRAEAHGWCVAVADGAGSAAHSRLGSFTAAECAAHAVAAALAMPEVALEDALARGAHAAQQALAWLAERAPCDPRALRTTLLVAAGRGSARAVMQVGDGAIICGTPADGFRQPVAGHGGEYAGEVSHFLPDPGALEALLASVTALPPSADEVLLLATDGVEDPWYPLARTAPGLLASLAGASPPAGTVPTGLTLPAAVADNGGVLTAADPAAALVAWLGFERRGENDDRTLALVRPPGSRAWLASAAR